MSSKKEILGVWRNMPLYRLIIEELITKPHGLSERELVNILKKEHGIDLSRNELYQALLKLEINGFIRVDHIGGELVARISPYIEKILR